MTTIQSVLIISVPVPVLKRVCVKNDSRISSKKSRMMSVLSRSTQFMTSNSYRELPAFFTKKYTHKLDFHNYRLVIDWWVLCDIGEKWYEELYNIPVINHLTELNECLVVEIPTSARVYPSGRHTTVIPIVVMCVDNNGMKTMTNRTCIRLDVSLKA